MVGSVTPTSLEICNFSPPRGRGRKEYLFFYLPLIRQTDRRTGRVANKKAQALRAKAKSDLRIAQFQLSKNCEYCSKLLFPFCYIP
jgi:hypothetical protein